MSEEIENLLNQAIEFLNKDLETSQALSNMLVTFILQLLATLVLFLVIRFKFWNVITAMIEKRETKIADSLKEKDEALKEATGVTPNLRSGDAVGSYGETLRLDLNGD